MPWLNLFLLLLLAVTQECAASSYGLLSSTHAVMVAAAGAASLALLALCRAAARIVAPRGDRATLDARVALGSHALVAVLLVLVFMADPVAQIDRLPYVPTHSSTGYWMLGATSLLALGIAVLVLRALPARAVGGFFTFALLGALAVATAEAALQPSADRAHPAPSELDAGTDPELPNLYYIVLDGHASLRAFPPATPGARDLLERIRRDYRGHGLRLHELAYSRFQWTEQSLYSILDNAVHPDGLEGGDEGPVMPDNKLFDQMIARGYRPWIHTSDYFDLCQAARAGAPRCERYRANSLDEALYPSLPAAQKYPLLLASVLHRFFGGAVLAQKKRAFGTINSVRAFERLIQSVDAHPRGTFVFAHILLPHEPFILDHACGFDASEVWSRPFQEHYSLIHPTVAARHWAEYVRQVECTHSLVMKLVDALERAGLYDDATLIIHGDHGARIRTTLASGREAPGAKLGQRTYLDFLATHFALKPGAFPLEHGSEAGRARWETVDNLLAERMGWPTAPVTRPEATPAAPR